MDGAGRVQLQALSFLSKAFLGIHDQEALKTERSARRGDSGIAARRRFESGEPNQKVSQQLGNYSRE